jgi:DNA modification methylase
VKIEMLAISALNEAPFNVRVHKPDEIERRWLAFKYLGFHHELVVWGNAAAHGYPAQTILGGHGRRLSLLWGVENEGLAAVAAVENVVVRGGEVYAPCHVVSCDDKTAKRINLSLNGHEAENDPIKLRDLIIAVDLGDVSIEVVGIPGNEISALIGYEAKAPAGPADDDVPAPGPARCKRGDVWTLGDHRLACGDATAVADVERLMAGEKAAMLFTDPPYNVNYGVQKNPKWKSLGKFRTIAGDNMKPAAWEAFNRAWIANAAAAVPAGDIYVWGAPGPEGMKQRLWLVELGAHWSATVVWIKNAIVLASSKYQRLYEPCFYGWFGARSSFRADRKQTEVWEFDRPSRSDEHPTMKPIALCIHGITNSSAPGAVVLDLFGGAGSTLIACEKAARRCRILEIEPKYCDVILRRWEAFMGRKATKAPAAQSSQPASPRPARANVAPNSALRAAARRPGGRGKRAK